MQKSLISKKIIMTAISLTAFYANCSNYIHSYLSANKILQADTGHMTKKHALGMGEARSYSLYFTHLIHQKQMLNIDLKEEKESPIFTVLDNAHKAHTIHDIKEKFEESLTEEEKEALQEFQKSVADGTATPEQFDEIRRILSEKLNNEDINVLRSSVKSRPSYENNGANTGTPRNSQETSSARSSENSAKDRLSSDSTNGQADPQIGVQAGEEGSRVVDNPLSVSRIGNTDTFVDGGLRSSTSMVPNTSDILGLTDEQVVEVIEGMADVGII